MSPFKSKSQMRAAFGGYLGKEMKSKAKNWAKETPNIQKLPEKATEVEQRKAKVTKAVKKLIKKS